ncbi:MAG: hypothetical protein QME16_02220 [Planctomycetota bacterium]|nr:hypothetical protein [Planctomycetota bacterium]
MEKVILVSKQNSHIGGEVCVTCHIYEFIWTSFSISAPVTSGLLDKGRGQENQIIESFIQAGHSAGNGLSIPAQF